ncbi:MAG: methyltransferase domain-containing protein [Bacteroidetes bacterium]|nr:methyltransferase domain-containing protein [Bacteroidota bacterium]
MLKQRSIQKELLDADDIPEADLYQNLKELNTINKLLGGYGITFSALNKVCKKNQSYTLVDIGCGGGHTLKQIDNWAKKNNQKVTLYGIDIKSVCIQYAKKNAPQLGFICDDYKNTFLHLPQANIIHACLFCHHLQEDELIKLIQFCLRNKATLIINDLERNPFAYYAIKILARLFSKSYLVKNDAPLSVARGFKTHEWHLILEKAGAKQYSVTKKWAFRHEILVHAT